MRSHIICRFGLICTAMSGAARASALPATYDCNAATGAVSEIEEVQKSPVHTFRGQVTPKLLRRHKEQMPVATMRLMSADRKDGIVLIAVGDGPDSDELVLVVMQAVNGQQRQRPVGRVKSGKAIPFSFRINGSSVRAQLGEQSVDLNVTIGSDTKVGVSCSTGEFLFDGLSVSHLRR